MNDYGKAGIPFFFIIDFEQRNPVMLRMDEWQERALSFEFPGFSWGNEHLELSKEIYFHKNPVSFLVYQEAFNQVKAEIAQGNSYLVNLTFSTPIQTNLSLQEIFAVSDAKYKLRWKDEFVCFSPETFVKIQNGLISTYPMKGTIDASIPHAQERLLADKKEFAEHVTVVDLLRNDLSMVADKVRVKRFRYIEEIETPDKKLLQMSSHIEGKLSEGFRHRIGDIIFRMLPAGSICGAPKPKTVEIIQTAENHRRGYYTGIMGFFDGLNLDSAVMIRYIENNEQGYVYKSGGGITYQSRVEQEYQEMIDKVYVPISGKYRHLQANSSTSLLA